MTPKKNAIALIHKFYNEIPLLDGCSWCNVNYRCESICDRKYKSAKQCALIAVDNILDNSVSYNAYDGVVDDGIWADDEYWQEVKKEIEKL